MYHVSVSNIHVMEEIYFDPLVNNNGPDINDNKCHENSDYMSSQPSIITLLKNELHEFEKNVLGGDVKMAKTDVDNELGIAAIKWSRNALL